MNWKVTHLQAGILGSVCCASAAAAAAAAVQPARWHVIAVVEREPQCGCEWIPPRNVTDSAAVLLELGLGPKGSQS